METLPPSLEVEEEKLTNLSYVVKDGNQITRMSWAKEERDVSNAGDSESFWVLGKLRAWGLSLGPGAWGPIKGREMELVFIEPLLCAGVI